MFEGHSGIRYPDFYKDDMVLDAKYKRLGSYNKVSMVDPDDVHQVMAYMSALHVNKGGFIAPLENKQDKIPKSQIFGTLSYLYIFGIEINQSSSYDDFCERMKEKEDVFIKSIIKNCLNPNV